MASLLRDREKGNGGGTPSENSWKVYEVEFTLGNRAGEIHNVQMSQLWRNEFPISKVGLIRWMRDNTTRESYASAPLICSPEIVAQYNLPATVPEQLRKGRKGTKRKGPATHSEGNATTEAVDIGTEPKAKKKKTKKEPENQEGKPEPEPATKVDPSAVPTTNTVHVEYPTEDLLVDRSTFSRKNEEHTDERYPVVCTDFCGVTQQLIGDALRLFDFMYLFGKTLRLSPFNFDDFLEALMWSPTHPERNFGATSNELLEQIHKRFLHELLLTNGKYGCSSRRKGAAKKAAVKSHAVHAAHLREEAHQVDDIILAIRSRFGALEADNQHPPRIRRLYRTPTTADGSTHSTTEASGSASNSIGVLQNGNGNPSNVDSETRHEGDKLHDSGDGDDDFSGKEEKSDNESGAVSASRQRHSLRVKLKAPSNTIRRSARISTRRASTDDATRSTSHAGPSNESASSAKRPRVSKTRGSSLGLSTEELVEQKWDLLLQAYLIETQFFEQSFADLSSIDLESDSTDAEDTVKMAVVETDSDTADADSDAEEQKSETANDDDTESRKRPRRHRPRLLRSWQRFGYFDGLTVDHKIRVLLHLYDRCVSTNSIRTAMESLEDAINELKRERYWQRLEHSKKQHEKLEKFDKQLNKISKLSKSGTSTPAAYKTATAASNSEDDEEQDDDDDDDDDDEREIETRGDDVDEIITVSSDDDEIPSGNDHDDMMVDTDGDDEMNPRESATGTSKETARSSYPRPSNRVQALMRIKQLKQQEEHRREQELRRKRQAIKALQKSEMNRVTEQKLKSLRENRRLRQTREEHFAQELDKYRLGNFPLGNDRYFCNYWYFPGIPDRLFVENTAVHALNSSVWRSINLQPQRSEDYIAQAYINHKVDINAISGRQFEWAYFADLESIGQLQIFLDGRGVREKRLKETLRKQMHKFTRSMKPTATADSPPPPPAAAAAQDTNPAVEPVAEPVKVKRHREHAPPSEIRRSVRLRSKAGNATQPEDHVCAPLVSARSGRRKKAPPRPNTTFEKRFLNYVNTFL